jgi:hypothetical protein
MAIVVAIPTTMPAMVVMSVSTAILTVIASTAVSIVANADANSLCASNGWRGYSQRRNKNKSKFPHPNISCLKFRRSTGGTDKAFHANYLFFLNKHSLWAERGENARPAGDGRPSRGRPPYDRWVTKWRS